jgi:opacity protein-like surface antigen
MSWVRRLVAAGACTAACGLSASAAHAQTAMDGGRIEIAAGVMWTGAVSLGTVAATETAPSGRFTLFSTATELAAAPGVEARIGVRLTPVLEVEASSSYAQPRLQTAVSGDVEHGAPVTASESLRQFTVDGAVVANLTRWRIGSRATPFVLAGVGYLREVHQGENLAAAGQMYFAGGGIKYLLMSRPRRLKGVGVRADVRALARRNGVAFDTVLHASPVIGASLFVRF